MLNSNFVRRKTDSESIGNGNFTKEDLIYNSEEIFILVRVSKLSLDDEFMKHEPKTKAERRLKRELMEIIRTKAVKDFFKPKCDPSFSANYKSFFYQPGNKPATGQLAKWWKLMAKEYMPECNSRIGTRSEYIAFLGVLIYELIESGVLIHEAWDMVCNDSSKLGHYWGSKDSKHGFEETGLREVCGFCDLANTFKLLVDDVNENDFWLASGSCYSFGDAAPIACIQKRGFRVGVGSYAVGWLVLDIN